MVGVRVVVPHDLQPLGAHLALEPPQIIRRDEIAVGIVGPPVDRGPSRTTSLTSAHRVRRSVPPGPAALGRVRRGAVRGGSSSSSASDRRRLTAPSTGAARSDIATRYRTRSPRPAPRARGPRCRAPQRAPLRPTSPPGSRSPGRSGARSGRRARSESRRWCRATAGS